MNAKTGKMIDYFLYFMMYAVMGWCYEVFLETVVYRWGFTNRGVLFGPYCPVYGVGALIFIFAFRRRIRSDRHGIRKLLEAAGIFAGCMLAATALELFTSYLLEFFTGAWPWQTYLDYRINFQGRIALSPSIRFGLGGLLFLYVMQPLFEKVMALLGNRKTVLAAVVFSVFFVDLAVTIVCRL